MIGETIGRKFARLATNAAVRNPRAWRFFRPLIRWQFDSLAPVWASMQLEDSLASYRAGLEALPAPPARALDLGTGTGAGASAIARRFPEAEVVGADLSEGMLAEARRGLPEELRARVEFQQADASALPDTWWGALFSVLADRYRHYRRGRHIDSALRLVLPSIVASTMCSLPWMR